MNNGVKWVSESTQNLFKAYLAITETIDRVKKVEPVDMKDLATLRKLQDKYLSMYRYACRCDVNSAFDAMTEQGQS